MNIVKEYEMKRWTRDIASYEHYKNLLIKAKSCGFVRLETIAINGMTRIKESWPNVKFE